MRKKSHQSSKEVNLLIFCFTGGKGYQLRSWTFRCLCISRIKSRSKTKKFANKEKNMSTKSSTLFWKSMEQSKNWMSKHPLRPYSKSSVLTIALLWLWNLLTTVFLTIQWNLTPYKNNTAQTIQSKSTKFSMSRVGRHSLSLMKST